MAVVKQARGGVVAQEAGSADEQDVHAESLAHPSRPRYMDKVESSMNEEAPGEHRAQLWTLFACQTVLSAGLALAFPFFALYLHRERGMPMGQVGAWLALSMLVTALSQGVGGELSDAWGRRRVMVFSLWARTATILAMAWVMRSGGSFALLIGVHLVSSFFAHFFDPAARSWVADHTPPRGRAHAYGLLRMASNLGFAVGPAVGGLLASRGYAPLFFLSGAVCAVCAVGVSLGVRDRRGVAHTETFEATGVLKASTDRVFLRFCGWNVLISVAKAQLIVSLSVYAAEFVGLAESQVGLLFSLNGLIVVLFQYPATLLLARGRLSRGLAAGCLLYAVGYCQVGAAGGFAGLALAMVVLTCGELFVSPTVHALAANMAPPRLRGRYLGFVGLSQQVGAALGPLTGGLGLQYLSARWVPGHWLAVACVAAAAGAGFYSMGRKLKPGDHGLDPDAAEITDAADLGFGA